MLDEATPFEGAEFEPAPDTDESLINVLNGDDEPETQAIDESTESDAQPAVETFTVKINGKEKAVTREELIAHYQKQEAAQEKFEQAAQVRKEAEQRLEQFNREQALMQQALEQITAQVHGLQEQEPNWDQLLKDDPHEYLIQREAFNKKQAVLQQAQAAQAYLYQQQQIQQQQQLQQHLQAEQQKLLNDYLPEWKNQEVREKEEQELISYLRGKGYSDQDLMNLNHSRAGNIALAINAMRYDKLLEKAKAAKKPQAPQAASIVPTVGGKAGAVKDPSNMTDAEFNKWRQETRRGRR